MIYFTADTHFYHSNIIKYCSRPFENVEEMNNVLIKNWNKKIKESDEVYILGDFLLGDGNKANEILKILNGKKYFIKGNHDSFIKHKDFNITLFEWIKDIYTLKINKQKIILCHYPMLSWDSRYHDSIHVYGHVHNTDLEYRVENSYNVGVDVNDFKPISLDEILIKIK